MTGDTPRTGALATMDVDRTALAAITCLLLLVGAVVVHARARDPLPAMVPALATLTAAAGYVAVTLAA